MTAPLRHDDRSDGAAAPQPFFLAGAAGPLFCLQLAPAPGVTPRGALLYLPPFAEEANRSRRMAVLQARRLAARGWPVLLLDPFGTGDSAGAFHEARWELWLADAARAAAWLATRWPGGPVTLWGLRLGALLAAALAAREPGPAREAVATPATNDRRDRVMRSSSGDRELRVNLPGGSPRNK